MTDSVERYAGVHAVFDGARGLGGAERRAYLAERCGAQLLRRPEAG